MARRLLSFSIMGAWGQTSLQNIHSSSNALVCTSRQSQLSLLLLACSWLLSLAQPRARSQMHSAHRPRHSHTLTSHIYLSSHVTYMHSSYKLQKKQPAPPFIILYTIHYLLKISKQAKRAKKCVCHAACGAAPPFCYIFWFQLIYVAFTLAVFRFEQIMSYR